MDGTVDNQRGNTYKVAKFKDIGIDPVSPVELPDFTIKITQSAAGPQQSFIGADDRDVIPHGAPDLIPVVVDVDQFIRRSSIPMLPLGNGRYGVIFPGRAMMQDSGESPAGHDVSFKQAVGSQAIGSVKPGGGYFSDGKKPSEVGSAIRIGKAVSMFGANE